MEPAPTPFWLSAKLSAQSLEVKWVATTLDPLMLSDACTWSSPSLTVPAADARARRLDNAIRTGWLAQIGGAVAPDLTSCCSG
eukprot:COSAG01_NODE_1112_length_11654_cov_8.254435_2_plen_83_part_00